MRTGSATIGCISVNERPTGTGRDSPTQPGFAWNGNYQMWQFSPMS